MKQLSKRFSRNLNETMTPRPDAPSLEGVIFCKIAHYRFSEFIRSGALELHRTCLVMLVPRVRTYADFAARNEGDHEFGTMTIVMARAGMRGGSSIGAGVAMGRASARGGADESMRLTGISGELIPQIRASCRAKAWGLRLLTGMLGGSAQGRSLRGIQKVKRAVSCIVRAVACVSWPKLPLPSVVTSPYKLV